MNKTNIEWCDYTWNPVVGCKRGCIWCYAKALNDRFKFIPKWNELKYYPERLMEPDKLKKPATIFVGSMSDPEYWDMKWFDDIVKVCERNKRHTFMFLTKNSSCYFGRIFPDNCIIGITMTLESSEKQFEQFDGYLSYHRRGFVSIEPIMGRLYLSKLAFAHCTEKVIVGAMTGPNAIAPHPEWIQSIKNNVPEDKIFWKSNIKKYLEVSNV